LSSAVIFNATYSSKMARGRRSERHTGPRAVYVDDPFQAAGISDEDDAKKRVSSPKGRGKRAKKEDSPSDDEFVAVSGEEADDAVEEEEEAEEQAEDEPEEETEPEDDVSVPEEMEIDNIECLSKKQSSASQPREPQFKKRAAGGIIVPSADETHSRGIIDPKDHLSKDTYYTLTFGSDERDLMAAVHSRSQWSRGIDSTFPTRSALEGGDEEDYSLYGPTFGVHPDDVKKESTRGWDWYYDGNTGERFRKRQRVETIKESMARQKYLPRPDERKHRVRLGPYEKQELFDLGYHESFDFGKAWGEANSNTKPEKAREGWILNIGHKTNCMAWAPNQDGLFQYLAVAAPLPEDQKSEHRSEESEPFSAFHPSESFPSALQIWEFKAKRNESKTKTLDMDYKPRLRQVICADWGDLRRMAWCTIPRAKREEDDEEIRKSIGLLATVWSDGKVRVLDIKTDRGSQMTEFGSYF
jgi:transcription factor C subunit 6